MPIDSQKVHQHIQSIIRINTVLAILSLLAVFGLYIWLRWFVAPAALSAQQQTPQQQAAINEARQQSIAQLTAEYQSRVLTAVGRYQFNEPTEAERILSTVLELRVPAELKSFHLQLVIALNDAKSEKYEDAQKRIQTVRAQFAWFR